jgi:hypothetical protein
MRVVDSRALRSMFEEDVAPPSSESEHRVQRVKNHHPNFFQVCDFSSMASRKPARISFSSITPNNLGTLRKLNSVLFPIRYSEKFYQDVLLPELEDFCKLGPSS